MGGLAGPGHPDLVAAVDVDVLDVVVVEQRLEPPGPEHAGEHALGELLLGLGVQRRLADTEQLLCVLTDHVADQLAGVLLLTQTHELAQPRLGPPLLLAVQPVADLAVHAAEQIRVDPHAGTPVSTSTVTMEPTTARAARRSKVRPRRPTARSPCSSRCKAFGS